MLRSAYSPRKRHPARSGGQQVTVQYFKEQVNVNNIVQRHTAGAEWSTTAIPQYGDFTSVPDYKTSLDQIRAADAAFMQLPAKLRAKFDNDPHHFITFCTDPENSEALISMGIKSAPQTEPQTAPKPTETSDGAPS